MTPEEERLYAAGISQQPVDVRANQILQVIRKANARIAELEAEVERLREIEVNYELPSLRSQLQQAKAAFRNIADPDTDYEAGIEIARAAIKTMEE